MRCIHYRYPTCMYLPWLRGREAGKAICYCSYPVCRPLLQLLTTVNWTPPSTPAGPHNMCCYVCVIAYGAPGLLRTISYPPTDMHE